MATISKFYLHDVATPNTGTMPTGAFLNSNDSTGDATGARTARDATDVIGAAQTSSTITATANQLAQLWGHRRFVSRPLAAQTIAFSAGLSWTWSWARDENNLNHNLQMRCQIYAWRPSTGLRVGSGAQNLGAGGTEPTVASTEQAENGTFGSGQTDVTISDGDILVFEIFSSFTQSKSSALTDTFYYDGTTEASATSCASFITPNAAITLQTVTAHSLVPPGATKSARTFLLRR